MSITATKNEKTLAALRDLYTSYGYAQYRMRKFEEYELYVRNKSFLTSDHMITFTDREGRLMALKPDVTLSIVKNTRENAGTEKVYYHESVYREEKGSNSFQGRVRGILPKLGVCSLKNPKHSCIISDHIHSLLCHISAGDIDGRCCWGSPTGSFE